MKIYPYYFVILFQIPWLIEIDWCFGVEVISRYIYCYILWIYFNFGYLYMNLIYEDFCIFVSKLSYSIFIVD